MIPYHMTDSDMAQLRQLIPHHRWTRGKDGSGGAQTKTQNGLRIWVTAYPVYQEPRTGWEIQVMAEDWMPQVELNAKTMPGVVTLLGSWALGQVVA